MYFFSSYFGSNFHIVFKTGFFFVVLLFLCRLREIERNNLDRHSYEIQIKELTQRLADEESYRGENVKLVEFIKRQQGEIEYLQGITRDSNVSADGLKQTYERSLEMTNKLTNENLQLRQHIEELRTELMNLRARYEAMEKSKNLEIDQVRAGLAQNSKDSYEMGVGTIKLQYEGELKKYEF